VPSGLPSIRFLPRPLAARCAHLCTHSFIQSHHVLCDSRLSQTKLKRKAEAKEEEHLSSRPAWVLDHNLCRLWSEGLEEDMIPENLRLTADAMAQVKQLCRWAEGQVAQLEQGVEQPQPQPQPPPTVPTVAAAAFVSPLPVAPVPRVQFIADSATLAKVAALKVGPRVGPSPATVLEM
jgi:hypothetical protein